MGTAVVQRVETVFHAEERELLAPNADDLRAAVQVRDVGYRGEVRDFWHGLLRTAVACLVIAP
jgi:hypothetical protein